MSKNGSCQFMYSADGNEYESFGNAFTPTEGKWIGAKVGLFCRNNTDTIDNSGYVDFDWFTVKNRFSKLPEQVYNPVPGNGDSLDEATYVKLTWEADVLNTEEYNIYFDTVPNPVESVKTQTGTTYYARNVEVNKTYYWRVDAKNPLGSTTGEVWSFTVKESISARKVSEEQGYMFQIAPNPFSSHTHITFTLTRQTSVQLVVYNCLGEQVSTIANREFPGGEHRLRLDRNSLAKGVYLIKMSMENQTLIRKIIIQ
jgi:hypothetical protein